MKGRIISIPLSYQQEFVKKFGSNYYKENKTGYITFVSKNKLNMAQGQFKVVK